MIVTWPTKLLAHVVLDRLQLSFRGIYFIDRLLGSDDLLCKNTAHIPVTFLCCVLQWPLYLLLFSLYCYGHKHAANIRVVIACQDGGIIPFAILLQAFSPSVCLILSKLIAIKTNNFHQITANGAKRFLELVLDTGTKAVIPLPSAVLFTALIVMAWWQERHLANKIPLH